MAKRTADEWRELIAQQQSSELSIVDFCKHTNLPLSTFHKYRSKLGVSQTRHTPDNNKFMPITVDKTVLTQPLQHTTPDILLTFNKVQLQFNSQCDAIWLVNLIKALNQ
jgi:hypothetical protein